MKKVSLLFLIFLICSCFVSAFPLNEDPILVDNKEPSKSLFLAITADFEDFKFDRADGISALTFREFSYSQCGFTMSDIGGSRFSMINTVYVSGEISSITCRIYFDTPEDPNTGIYTDYKYIGESCNSWNECGSTCTAFNDLAPIGKYYTPRCLDGGNGRICFCGQDFGVYSTVCVRNSDCPENEECVSGICTTVNTPDTGNPINPDTGDEIDLDRDDIEDVMGDGKCSDGTTINLCSATVPNYCTKQGQLISYSSVCGCEEGLVVAADGNTCCEEGFDCVGTCTNGDKRYATCPDNSKRIIAQCYDSGWATVDSICQGNPIIPKFRISLLIAPILAIIGILMMFFIPPRNIIIGGGVVIIGAVVAIVQFLL